MLRTLIQVWFSVSVLLGGVMFLFRLTDQPIPILDGVSIKGGPEEPLFLSISVNEKPFNITIAYLSNDTEATSKKYGQYLVAKATEFCESNAEELELNIPPQTEDTEEKDKDAEAVDAAPEPEVFDFKKSYAYQRCVETIANHLLEKATEDFFERNTPPPKVALEYMKLDDVNITALSSNPLLIDLRIPIVDGKTYTVRFDVLSATPYVIGKQFCGKNAEEFELKNLEDEVTCIDGVQKYVIEQLSSLDAESLQAFVANVRSTNADINTSETTAAADFDIGTDATASLSAEAISGSSAAAVIDPATST